MGVLAKRVKFAGQQLVQVRFREARVSNHAGVSGAVAPALGLPDAQAKELLADGLSAPQPFASDAVTDTDDEIAPSVEGARQAGADKLQHGQERAEEVKHRADAGGAREAGRGRGPRPRQ